MRITMDKAKKDKFDNNKFNNQVSEEKLDLIIDTINEENDPCKKITNSIDEQQAEILAAVRAVKSLRDPQAPTPDLGKRINKLVNQKSHQRRPWKLGTIAAGIILLFCLIFGKSLWGGDIVLAMEKAVLELSNYHGILEMRTKNAVGEEWLVRQVEIWSAGEKYALRQSDGLVTVNNGEQKWQIRPEKREVALLPLAPDYTKKGFDIRNEADQAKKYPHSIVGRESIAGREAVHLRISPPGGDPYDLWVDAETYLPLQLQTAVQNALQATYTFVSFEPNIQIDPRIFSLEVPDGYQIVEEEAGQSVYTLEEAYNISGFVPVIPQDLPKRVYAFAGKIVLDFGATTIVQTPAEKPLEIEGQGALGQINGQPVEIIQDKLRWQQQGLEIIIEGPHSLELARQIAPNLILPDKNLDLAGRAQVKVEVDLEIAQAEQKQVDGGHAPWHLDPLFVAHVFVNLQIAPEGIFGEPKIPYAAFELETNTGIEALVSVGEGPIGKVYLKRLVREDESGIWSVVGYDPM